MGDDEWNHRSQFLDVMGRKSRSVTEAVNTRKKGERVPKHEEAYMLADVEASEESDETDLTWG